MQNTDWQHRCLDSILDRVFQGKLSGSIQTTAMLMMRIQR